MKIGLGTVQFGLAYGIANTVGRVTLSEGVQILAAARDANIDTLDTAIGYGKSESFLGQLGVTNYKIVSKLPEIPESCSNVSDWVNDNVRAAVSRLGVQKLHGFLLHRPSQLLGRIGSRLYGALEALKAEGIVEKIGISIYDPNELDLLLSRWRFDLVQAPVNILDRSLVDSGWAARLKKAGVEVHGRSAFLQGLLIMDSAQLPEKFQRWDNIWQEWKRWLIQEDLTPVQACLRYCLSLENVDRVIVGVDTAAQLKEILEAANGELSSLPNFPLLQDHRITNPSRWNEL